MERKDEIRLKYCTASGIPIFEVDLHRHLKVKDGSVDDPGDPLRRLFVFRDDAQEVEDGPAMNRRHPRRQDRRLHPAAKTEATIRAGTGLGPSP